MKCAECGSQMRLSTAPIVEQYKGVTVTATGIEHYVCDACGEYELEPASADELSKQLIEGYARARGLLTPQQIREARKKIGLTQTQFEAILGVSSPTASRWETGAMSPSMSVCKLIRILLDHPEFVAGNQIADASTARRTQDSPLSAANGWRVLEGGSTHLQHNHYRAAPETPILPSGYFAAKEG